MRRSNLVKALAPVLAVFVMLLFSACGDDEREALGVMDPPEGPADTAEAQGGSPVAEDGLTGGAEEGLEGDLGSGAEAVQDGNYPPGAFPFSFAAEDLKGESVTEKSLGQKRLFFVHYWATWCGPCVSEMPELAAIAEGYSEEVGFLALLDDYSSNIDGAKNITRSAGVPDSFIMVDAETPGLEGLLLMVSSGYVPTTVLVGADGEMIGEQLIGSYGRKYAAVLDDCLSR
ncbi:MAG: TlpA family protein disulfide reductase [Clostridiales bacterium]|nr:TlpA family protein disulfide reductase [Clostridiales bacterium]